MSKKEGGGEGRGGRRGVEANTLDDLNVFQISYHG